MNRVALITGITGMDGSYLTELLLDKGYEVHGIIRRSSNINTKRIEHVYDKIHLHYGDVIDYASVDRIIRDVHPTEIYNLAAQSHVKVSFEVPVYTTLVDSIGPLNIFEVVKNFDRNIGIYQASSSEMFGNSPPPQNEATPFNPVSPYGVAKLSAYWNGVNYRNAYDMFITNGVLFNHEGPRRGETFVTKKITRGIARILTGKQKELVLGNLDAKRDWGYAGDYVEAMYKMMQLTIPRDFVIGTGIMYSVKDFLQECYMFLYDQFGVMNLESCVKTDSKYYRPNELHSLQANAGLANELLDWYPKVTFQELVEKMLVNDLKEEGYIL